MIFVDRTKPAAPGVPPKKSQPARPAKAVAQPPAKRSAPWWIVPLVILGLIAVALFMTTRGPGEGEKVASADSDGVDQRIAVEPGTLVPADQPAAGTAAPGTVAPFGTPAAPPVVSTQAPPPPVAGTVAPAPPATASVPRAVPAPQQKLPQVASRPHAPSQPPIPPPMTSSRPSPPPPPQQQPAPAPQPAPPAQTPPPPPVDAQRVTSDAEAVSIARRYIVRNDYYDTHPDCLSVRSVGYINVGYTLEAWDTCPSSGGTRRIGVWRVDAITGEVFRQQSDGRFLRP